MCVCAEGAFWITAGRGSSRERNAVGRGERSGVRERYGNGYVKGLRGHLRWLEGEINARARQRVSRRAILEWL